MDQGDIRGAGREKRRSCRGRKQARKKVGARLHLLLDKQMAACCNESHPIAGALTLAAKETRLKRLFDNLAKNVWKNRASFDQDLFELTARILADGLARGWKGKKKSQLQYDGINDIFTSFGTEDYRIAREMKQNVYMFAGAKTYTVAKELNNLLQEHKTFSEFQKAAEGIYPAYYQRFLQTEYNLAYTTAQNAVQYQEMVRDKDIYVTWIYRTVGDDHVRESHRLLEGKMFRADDPVFDTIAPPNAHGCRCYLEPSREKPEKYTTQAEALKILESSGELKRMRAGGFAVNRAKERYVFAPGETYFRNADYRDLKRLAKEMMANDDTWMQVYKSADGHIVKAHTSQVVEKEFAENFDAAKWLADNVKSNVNVLEYDPEAKKGVNLDIEILQGDYAGRWDIKTPKKAGYDNIQGAIVRARRQGYERCIIKDNFNLDPAIIKRALKGSMKIYHGEFKEVLLIQGDKLQRITYDELMDWTG